MHWLALSFLPLSLLCATVATTRAFGQASPVPGQTIEQETLSSPHAYPHIGTTGPIATNSDLDQMQDSLRMATPAQARDLLERLGVEDEVAKAATQTHDDLQTIRIDPVPAQVSPTVRINTRYAILFLPNTLLESAGVYLLTRAQPASKISRWHSSDHRDAHWFANTVQCEILPLAAFDMPLIALHHDNASHGSGESEDSSEFFAIHAGKLASVLKTTDFRLGAHWINNDTSQAEEQHSVFLPVEDGSIEETRSTLYDGRLEKLERRYWHCHPSQNKFTATKFARVKPL